jgi:hypothetical protein
MNRLRFTCALLLMAGFAFGQAKAKKYNGPRPDGDATVYLLHASRLLPLEVGQAVEEKQKDGSLNYVNGPTASTETPIPEPVFLVRDGKIAATKLVLWRLQSKKGRRELFLPVPSKMNKNSARPVRTTITPLEPGLFRVEVQEILEPGEYCFSPDGSMSSFCFRAI